MRSVENDGVEIPESFQDDKVLRLCNVGHRTESSPRALNRCARSSLKPLYRKSALSVDEEQNRSVPPHAMTAENMRVVQVLNRLVDWEKYEKEDPTVL